VPQNLAWEMVMGVKWVAVLGVLALPDPRRLSPWLTTAGCTRP